MPAPRRLIAATTAIASIIALSGCAGRPDDFEAGFGLGTLDSEDATSALESAGVEQQNLSGALAVAPSGCFTWSSDEGAHSADGAWLVWPADARPDGDGVVLGDGRRVADGDRIGASGALVTLSDLPDGANRDSYFGAFGGFCNADERGVLVLVEVSD